MQNIMRIPKTQKLSDLLPDVNSMRVIYTPPQTFNGDPKKTYYKGQDQDPTPLSFTEILDKAQEKMMVQIFEDRIVYEKLETAINRGHIFKLKGESD